MNGFATGLFLFNNAPSHCWHADNMLSAHKMPKGPHKTWCACKNGTKMCVGVNPANGNHQDLYWPEDHPTMPGWYKGMEQIIMECNLWPAGGLQAEYKGFKCTPGHTDCCCQRLLFNQPNFMTQKSHLKEYIESCDTGGTPQCPANAYAKHV